ncbi:MAG: hypothetical protein AAFQ63_09565 [Cyanobacteria bacterium J06621_11]
MMRKIRLFAIAIFVSVFVVIFSGSNGLAQTVPDRVTAVYSATARATGVPLRVPSIIPLNSSAAPSEYWAFSIAPSSDRYSISFDRAADCTNVNECSFAIASGNVRTDTDQSLASLLDRADVNGAEAITLDNGAAAVYVPFREGMYAPAYVYWDIGEYRYTIGLYMASKSDVIAMANSVIAVD